MTTINLSSFEIGVLALVLNEELKRIEDETPFAFDEPDTYASALKQLHRRVLSIVPS